MSKNEELFIRAQKAIPGGVNSPVRAFRSVGGTPRFFTRGEGPYVWDADGKRYIDYVGSWGPLVLGHAHPEVIKAVQTAVVRGLTFGAPTEAEVEMAELLTQLLPGLDMVRLVSSGTEATMSAIRLARGFTGRDAIVKFEGCYHGHADSLLVKAGSGALTFGNPSSAGVPADIAAHTLVLGFNELAQVRDSLRKSVEAFVALFQNAKRVDPSIVNPGKAVLGVMTALVANEPPQAREIAVSGDCPQKRLSEVYANWQFLLRALQALGRGDDEAARGELAKVVDLEPLDWFPSLRDTLLGIVERSASRFRDAIDLVLAVYQRDFEREDGVLEKYDLCVPAMGLSMLALERELVALPELPASGPVYARDLLEYLLAEGRDDAR